MRREEPQTTRTHRGAGRTSVLSLLVASCSFASSSEFDGLQKGLPDDSATDAGLTRDTGPIFFDAAAADDAGTEAEASVQGDASFQDGADASPTQSVFVFQQAVFPTTAYAGARDTTLVEQSPLDIRGGNTEIAIDHDDPTASGKSLVALMRFDLSAVPAGSKVTSASLTLNVTNPTDGTPYQVFPLV